MSEGEPRPRQVMSGPLSAHHRYMLFVTGRFGARQIGHLIKQLELQKQFAEEDERDEPALAQTPAGDRPAYPAGGIDPSRQPEAAPDRSGGRTG